MRAQKIIINFFKLACFFILQGCGHPAEKVKEETITVQEKKTSNHLFYSGTIRPLKSIVVTSPVDGVVINTGFRYGQLVTKDQLLFVVSSAKFLSDYKMALTQYVKAKNEFNTSKTQLNETTFLHKNELISDDEYKMKQSNFYSAQLAFVQAKDSLELLLKQLNFKNIDLYKLAISDIDKINQALHLDAHSENLQIFAPAEGVVLSPTKSNDEVNKTTKGDAVKQGDVIALIGDLSGISVKIKVNELVINQLKPGQKVKITGIAFSEEELIGRVKFAEKQGEGSNNGLPTFSVQVVVPKLTLKQRELIHAGMSAKVELLIDNEAVVTVPIQAVKNQNGQTVVERLNEKLRHKEWVVVKTGKTTMDSVAILSGIQPGDKIVYTH